jgi:hypothetical protein
MKAYCENRNEATQQTLHAPALHSTANAALFALLWRNGGLRGAFGRGLHAGRGLTLRACVGFPKVWIARFAGSYDLLIDLR